MAALPLQDYICTSQTPISQMSPCDELSHALKLFLVQTFHHNCTTIYRPRRHSDTPCDRTCRSHNIARPFRHHPAPIASRSCAVLASMSHPDEASCSTGPCTPQLRSKAFQLEACALFKSRIEKWVLYNRQQEHCQDMARLHCWNRPVALRLSQYLRHGRVVQKTLLVIY